MGRNVKVRGSRPLIVYTELRRRILDGELAPDTPMSEDELAEQLDVRRTPVREALHRLASDGLVKNIANRGAFVVGLSGADIREIYEIREQLEPHAAGIAAREMSESQVRELRSDLTAARALARAGDHEGTFQSDVALHEQIVAVTRNARLIEILARLKDQVHRIRIVAGQSSSRLAETIAEHRAVVDAIADRDPARARHAMQLHLRAARDNALQMATTSHRR
jgi:DNA-binding GntR family transcriptional regulator